MKSIIFFTFLFITHTYDGNAQVKRTVKVKAGTKVTDYFSQSEVYRYPVFIQGKVVFNDGRYALNKYNFCILTGEMLFLNEQGDTLVINNQNKIRTVEIGNDTFYNDNGFLEVVTGKSPIMAMKQYVKISDIERQGAMGSKSSGTQSVNYGVDSRDHKLVAQEDMIMSANTDYYIGSSISEFTLYKKKRVLELFPEHNSEIENYITDQKINFKNKEQLISFTDFLQTLR